MELLKLKQGVSIPSELSGGGVDLRTAARLADPDISLEVGVASGIFAPTLFGGGPQCLFRYLGPSTIKITRLD